MKGLFYIPESIDDNQKLLNEIIERNVKKGVTITSMEFMYAIKLTEALCIKTIAAHNIKKGA